jgi:hypothetical protein
MLLYVRASLVRIQRFDGNPGRDSSCRVCGRLIVNHELMRFNGPPRVHPHSISQPPLCRTQEIPVYFNTLMRRIKAPPQAPDGL